MADFHSTDKEELCIDGVRKEGFGYSESLGFSEGEFPKYFVIRVALARALQLPIIPLESPQWKDKKLGGEKGKEYHLEQLTGKDSKNKDDFDVLTRALLYIQHKDELDRDNIDIFSNDKEYTKILGKYIKRGLYELHNSWKSSDCIYQWCLDNLNFNSTQNAQNALNETKSLPSDTSHFAHLQKYFRQFAINIQLMNETDSYRHHICKVELEDSSKISSFKTKAKYLDDEFGFPVLIESCEGLQRAYNIQIAKQNEQWQNLGLAEFRQGLDLLKGKNFKLGIYAGNDIDTNSLCFDLADAPHCFVAGTTGSGKTKFIQTMIVCLLQNLNVEIIVIDPKRGIDFRIFEPKIDLIADMKKVGETIDSLIDEMNERNAKMSEFGIDIQSLGFKFKVLIIDELNNLVENDKTIKDKLSRLAEMARQAGIHLVLGTQRPDGILLKGLRNNIDGKIALRVSKESESKIILDESGAEKLLGKGDMLIKVGSMSKPKHIFSCLLQNDEIKSLI